MLSVNKQASRNGVFNRSVFVLVGMAVIVFCMTIPMGSAAKKTPKDIFLDQLLEELNEEILATGGSIKPKGPVIKPVKPVEPVKPLEPWIDPELDIFGIDDFDPEAYPDVDPEDELMPLLQLLMDNDDAKIQEEYGMTHQEFETFVFSQLMERDELKDLKALLGEEDLLELFRRMFTGELNIDPVPTNSTGPSVPTKPTVTEPGSKSAPTKPVGETEEDPTGKQQPDGGDEDDIVPPSSPSGDILPAGIVPPSNPVDNPEVEVSETDIKKNEPEGSGPKGPNVGGDEKQEQQNGGDEGGGDNKGTEGGGPSKPEPQDTAADGGDGNRTIMIIAIAAGASLFGLVLAGAGLLFWRSQAKKKRESGNCSPSPTEGDDVESQVREASVSHDYANWDATATGNADECGSCSEPACELSVICSEPAPEEAAPYAGYLTYRDADSFSKLGSPY